MTRRRRSPAKQEAAVTKAAKAAKLQGYANGRATRQSIVEHASAAFAQKGFYGTSLRSIAREVGVDHTALLHHFGSKHALLLAVIDSYDASHGPSSDPDEALAAAAYGAAGDDEFADALIERLVSAAEHNAASPGLIRLLSVLTAEAGDESHPARAALQHRHAQLIGVLTPAIGRRRQRAAGEATTGSADGPWGDELTDEDRAILVISLWEGLQLFDALHPERIELPELFGRALRRLL